MLSLCFGLLRHDLPLRCRTLPCGAVPLHRFDLLCFAFAMLGGTMIRRAFAMQRFVPLCLCVAVHNCALLSHCSAQPCLCLAMLSRDTPPLCSAQLCNRLAILCCAMPLRCEEGLRATMPCPSTALLRLTLPPLCFAMPRCAIALSCCGMLRPCGAGVRFAIARLCRS